MSVFHNNALIGAGAGTGEAPAAAEYVIPKSLRFNDDDQASLSRTPSSAGNRKTFTYSCWFKRANITRGYLFSVWNSDTDSEVFAVNFSSSHTLNIDLISKTLRVTDQVFRDSSAWYHLVLAIDTTQSTASDRLKLYINGSQVTSFSTNVNFSQNDDTGVNGTFAHQIGRYFRNSSIEHPFDGLMADVQLVDGLALAPTDFGETRSSDGVWVPKEFAVTGTVYNSFVSNQYSLTGSSSLFDGSTSTVAQDWNGVYNSTASPAYRVEFTPPTPISYSSQVEIYSTAGPQSPYSNKVYIDTGSGYGSGISVVQNGWVTAVSGSGSFSKLKVEGLQNGTNIAAIKVDGTVLTDGNGYGRNGFHLNFSDSSTNEALGFDSAPTTPDPDPKKGFDVITYDGTYARLNVGGALFEPGLIWIKNRDSGTSAHFLADSVRGGTKVLQSNSSGAENTRSNHILSFNPDGFTLGADGTSNYPSGNSFVAWMWRAGGPAVSNTNGTITAQVSANTDYGFSIVTFTGTGANATVGHGLLTAPKFVMAKTRTKTDGWPVYHSGGGSNYQLFINQNDAGASGTSYFNGAPTSALVNLGNNSGSNQSGEPCLLYCWSEVAGFSKFGSWTGSGSASGNKVTTGFKPRFLMWKRTDTADNWAMVDSERSPSNPRDEWLGPFATDAEGTNAAYAVDFLDDGFELKATHVATNASGGNYAYMCFADRPGNNWDVNNIVTNEGLTTSKSQFDVVTYTGNGGTQAIGQPVYSDETTGGNNTSNMFDGSSSTWNNLTAGNTITFTPSRAIACTQLEIWVDTGTPIRVNVNGGGYGSTFTQSGLGYVDITPSGGITSLTSLLIDAPSGGGGSGAGIRGLRINGTTIVVDGNGGPGLKFQPDFLWIKSRSNSEGHYIANSVNGLTKNMRSNANSAEQTNTNGVTAANANSFTLGDSGRVNGSSQTYVAWAWKAGGTAVSNTDGSITSSVSANAAYGFSIVTYTGTGSAATVGHGLNATPSLVIYKDRSAAESWEVWFEGFSSDEYLYLNLTDAKSSYSGTFGSTPTNSVFGVGNQGNNQSGNNFVAYCFANVPGYQRIGTVTHSGSSVSLVLGFKPKFFLIKRIDSTGDWFLFDSERDLFDDPLRPNTSAADGNAYGLVPTNNGMNWVGGSFFNGDYIYLAIGDDEIGSDEDCLVDVPNAVTADADATDTTGGYQRGNYATVNPLNQGSNSSLTDGNLKWTRSSNGYSMGLATIGVSSGKWYYEHTFTGSQNNAIAVGIVPVDDTSTYPGQNSNSVGYNFNGTKVIGTTQTSYGATYDDGDVVGVAFDADNGKVEFYLNGVNQGTATTALTSGSYTAAVSAWGSGTGSFMNFGQMRFKYPMPTGFSSLNTTALPAATIEDGSAQFDAKLYTGASGSVTVTTEFSPDFVWLKNRSHADGWHQLRDAVRGGDRNLSSNSNSAESDASNKDLDFNSDGFTLTGTTDSRDDNYDGDSYVAWSWNAGANSDKTYTVKVVSDSGNKYRFDDHGTSAVTLDLAEGSTYIFDQSDSSNAGHPIRFGTSANGTDYTTGVTHTGTPGSAGAKTTLVLGTGVSTLYYSCANHSGMGGQINTNSTAGSTRLSGSENASSYLSDAVYSSSSNFSYTGTSGFSSGYGLDKIFDGNLSTYVDQVDTWSGGGAAHLTWTPATPIPVTSSLRIYGRWYLSSFNNQYLDRDVITINGSSTELVDTVGNSTSNHWFDLSSYIQDNNITSITEIKGISYPNGSNRLDPQWSAIEVDGKILVDSNVTPPAVPSLNSVVKANPEAGFSIVTFTNTASDSTVAHGLNAKPDMIIWKKTSGTSHWGVYHSALGATKYLYLNLTNAAATGSEFWNNTEPTSSVITTKGEPNSFGSAGDTVMYVMSAVAGYSAFGSYEGNGSNDGPFVHTGFRPRWLMIKRTDSTSNWVIIDAARSPFNEVNDLLYAEQNLAETVDDGNNGIDFLSNGFKLRKGVGGTNVNGATLIYIAFASNPFSANGGLAR